MTEPAPTAVSSRPWALILGASTGTGAAIGRAVARDPGFNVFGIHRGHYPEDADALAADLRSLDRDVRLHVADAGLPDGVQACSSVVHAALPPKSIKLFVHSISGASLGHFLATRGDAFEVRQFEKTFNYLAHSFAYWARALHELDLLAPGAHLLGLTNALHDQVLHNCGLIAAAKEALQSYVRYLAIELGAFGHRVNLLKFGTIITPAVRKVLGPESLKRTEDVHREMIPAGRMCTVEEVAQLVSVLSRDETAWFNGATIDFTGGMTLRLFDIVLAPD
jgi:NAD(P)-dependent dehydrogenase (short-subunit alcohol dehydrogenase family)